MARTSEELLAQLRQQLTRGRVVWSTVWVRRLWTTILDLMWTVSILLALTSLFVYLSDPTLGALYWYQLTTPSFWSANIVLFWPWSVLIFFTVLEMVRYLARVGRVRNTAARIKRHPEAIIIAHTLNINARISMTYRQPEDARPVTQVIAALSDADKVVWKDLVAQRRTNKSDARGHQYTGFDERGIRRFLAARTDIEIFEFINQTTAIPYFWSTSDAGFVSAYYVPEGGHAQIILARLTPTNTIKLISPKLWLLLTFAEILNIGEDN